MDDTRLQLFELLPRDMKASLLLHHLSAEPAHQSRRPIHQNRDIILLVDEGDELSISARNELLEDALDLIEAMGVRRESALRDGDEAGGRRDLEGNAPRGDRDGICRDRR